MTRSQTLAVIIGILVFLGLQASRIQNPWILEFDSAFQEMIAMHHLESGIRSNHFLPVLAELDGRKFYHTAHPPLLHIIYALLYKIFGVKEWVTRGFSLLLLLASISLMTKMLAPQTRPFFWLFALFNPLSFRLGMTTNYELLSIFSICLFVASLEDWLEKKKKTALLAAVLALPLILLSDWPAYLALPALLLTNRRERKIRKLMLGLFLVQAVFFALYVLYARSVAGEFALFAHGRTRSNPLYIFQLATYVELESNLSSMLGWPGLILVLASLVRFADNARKTRPAMICRFWLWFLLLLWLTAANLTSRHHVYLLYFFPLAALMLAQAAGALKSKIPAAAAVLLSFAVPDYLGLMIRDARGYYFAQQLKKLPAVRTAFSSAALGTLYFYDKIETMVPVSEKTAQALGELNFELMLLDRANPEVAGLIPLLRESDYGTLWAFPDMVVSLQKGLDSGKQFLAARFENLESGNDWWTPKAEVVWLENRAWYGLRQPPGPQKISSLDFETTDTCLKFRPAIVHPPLAAEGDGAGFRALGSEGEKKHLLYSRFLKKGAAAETSLKLHTLKNVSLITDAGPGGDFSFDDACWLEAAFISDCGSGGGP
jgi:hypothetical protein